MSHAVSPNFTVEKLAGARIEDMIDVFEDQMLGWLIEPANRLRDYEHAGFGILAIVLSYFESIGQFLDGERKNSRQQFVSGLKAVFPNLDPEIPRSLFVDLYDQIRCGLFHQGLTKSKVVITRIGENPIEVIHGSAHEVIQIRVVPVNLIDAIHRHLVHYVAELRNPVNTSLRQNFEAWFRARGA
jgi:hypothetical protein